MLSALLASGYGPRVLTDFREVVPGTGIEPVTRGFSICGGPLILLMNLAPCSIHAAVDTGFSTRSNPGTYRDETRPAKITFS